MIRDFGPSDLNKKIKWVDTTINPKIGIVCRGIVKQIPSCGGYVIWEPAYQWYIITPEFPWEYDEEKKIEED